MKPVNRAGLLLSTATAAVIGSSLYSAGDAAAAEAFSDVRNSYWASESIQHLAEENIVNGYSDGTYHPGEEINRGQVAELLTTAFSLDAGGSAPSFSDLDSGSYYAPFAQAVNEAGFMTGNGSQFEAGQDLTRQQMATVLVRAFSLEAGGGGGDVRDLNEASPTHRPNINILAQTGITQTSSGMFRPDETVTRAQFAVFLDRARAQAHTKDAGITEVAASSQNTVDVGFNRSLSSISVEDFSFEPSVGVLSVNFVDEEQSSVDSSETETVVRLTTGTHETGGHTLYYKDERMANGF
ncbi:S-layer homology domain-containing protein [Salibacterium halotolerans]|uniref:S-layer homology domain-containing protein n=1 Tax=Salibacterium halotolerans TaxID=1884432 RepID=A0A1I5L3D8_9BACI|nr:S-layer homology domain-containing protein [Salibacterium halotolerans]SFO91814.1 S-layer homology domain-containing protein [Salibacterium halotolerans]